MIGVECIWPLEAIRAEGPLRDAGANALWFVDIKQGRIHRCDAGGGERRTTDIGGNPSFLLPLEGGGSVVGNRDRLLRFDGDGIVDEVDRVAIGATDCLNDATVDIRGRAMPEARVPA